MSEAKGKTVIPLKNGTDRLCKAKDCPICDYSGVKLCILKGCPLYRPIKSN